MVHKMLAHLLRVPEENVFGVRSTWSGGARVQQQGEGVVEGPVKVLGLWGKGTEGVLDGDRGWELDTGGDDVPGAIPANLIADGRERHRRWCVSVSWRAAKGLSRC